MQTNYMEYIFNRKIICVYQIFFITLRPNRLLWYLNGFLIE